MLWAGADPYARGPSSPDENPDPESDASALELAAIYNHLEIFKLKPIRQSFTSSRARDLLEWACIPDKADLLKGLLDKGFRPGDLSDSGSSLIQDLLGRLFSWRDFRLFEKPSTNIDNYNSRERIKMIHLRNYVPSYTIISIAVLALPYPPQSNFCTNVPSHVSWLNMTKAEVTANAPMLADKIAIFTDGTDIESVVKQLISSIS